MVSTAANRQELNTAAERFHRDESLIYGVAAGFCEAVAGHIGIEKRTDVQTARVSSGLP